METAYEELGPTPRLTSSARPEQQRPINPKTARIIAELGLRFRPAAVADLEAHAASLALLTRDVGQCDPDLLERAANQWAQSERFMPKASELIALVGKLKPERGVNLQRLVNQGNAYLAADGRSDVHWIVKNGQVVIERKYEGIIAFTNPDLGTKPAP